MMIEISMVSIVIGFFLGYKVGFYRCEVKILSVLAILRKRTSK